MTHTYVFLTDNSTAATTLMTGFSPAPTSIHTFTAHILWVWSAGNDADILTAQNSSVTYASVLLPDVM